MKEGTKIVIGVVITVLLIIGLVVGVLVGGFFLMVHDDHENRQKTKQAEIDGREFGKTTDQNGCLEKGFSLKPGQYYFANMNIATFVGECLLSSQPIPNFCDGVPLDDDKWEVQKKWEAEQCEKFPKYPNDEPCLQTMSAKEIYCDVYVRRKKK